MFPYGIRLVTEGEYSFQIATREKALCDKLYVMKPTKNITEMEELLIDNLRMEEVALSGLNLAEIEFISELYRSANVRLLCKH